MNDKLIDRIIDEYIKDEGGIPEHINALINLANYDLYFGFFDESDNDGFVYTVFLDAIEEIRGCLDSLKLSTIWVDVDAGSYDTKKPQAWYDEENDEWVEPWWDSIYVVELKDIYKRILGTKLASYI